MAASRKLKQPKMTTSPTMKADSDMRRANRKWRRSQNSAAHARHKSVHAAGGEGREWSPSRHVDNNDSYKNAVTL